MGWKVRFGKSKKGPSQQALADVLDRLDEMEQRSRSNFQSDGLKAKMLAVKRVVTPVSDKGSCSESAVEVHVDTNSLNTLVGIIQDTMQGQHDATDERWPRKLQWPSQKYLRSSWIYIWEQLQPEIPFFVPGEAKVPSANAGHVACLGPCLLQASVPVHTLIVHGDLEYCTLLGHRLHIDLAVYFAALRTLAYFLKGNTHLRELVFAFTGCPQVVTDKSQEPVADCFASEVLPAFERVLEENETLRYVSFRVSHKPTQHVNIRRLCATSFEANCRLRTAFLCGLHPKAVHSAGPLAKDLPRDILKRILDFAFPLPGPSRVDFEFSHLSSSRNRSRFAFLKFGRWQDLPKQALQA